jgi:hypothetical protein
LDACFSLNVYYFLSAETNFFGFLCIKNSFSVGAGLGYMIS